MRYLPYGRGGTGQWLLSSAGSIAIHAGVILLMGAGVSQWFLPREFTPPRPEYQITLDQLESDTLADILERAGQADGQDAAEDLEAVDPDGLLTPENEAEALDALPGDDTTEALDAEDTAALEPDEIGAEGIEETPPEDLAATDPAKEIEDLAAVPAEELPEVTPEDGTEALPEAPLEADPVEEAEPETAEDTDPAAVEPDAIAPEAIAEAEPETLDVVEPEADETPVEDTPADTPEPVESAEVEATDALEAEPVEEVPLAAEDEIVGLDPVEEELQGPAVDDLSALLPEEDTVIGPAGPVNDDPLIVDDGTLVTDGTAVLDPGPSEEAVTPILGGETLAPIEEVPALDGTEVVQEEDLAALLPTEPETPDIADATDPTDAAQPLEPEDVTPPDEETEDLAPVEKEAPAEEIEAVEASKPDAEGQDGTEELAALPEQPQARPRGDRPRVVRRPRSPPSERDLAIGELLQRIRTHTTEDCVIALPRRDGEDGIGLALLAAEDGAMSAFADSLLTRPEDAEIRQTRTLLDERQCPALDYIARNVDYPATRIGMRLDRAEVPSGNRVSGVMRGAGNRNIGLFLVDNNGVVQDLERFLSRSEGFVRFDIPVTRVGPLRDTKQLLIAIASPDSLQPLKDRSGQRAAEVFEGLSNELARRAALAIVAFDVR